MASSSSPTKRPLLIPPPAPPSRPSSPRPLPPPLHLTIRFSTSLPDLHLDILHPDQTTIATLKSLIRPRLSHPASHSRLRFIHAGKILPPTSTLTSVLKPLPPPPPSANDKGGAKGKGKQPEGNPPPQRVYINCSIGDTLTDDELREEEEEAKKAAAAAITKPVPEKLLIPTATQTQTTTTTTTTAARRRDVVRGFDRLLAAGFTPAEVGQLRLQFRGIQAARHTPDTMPSPDTLRGMEDAWIDDNRGVGGAMPGSGGGAEGEEGTAGGGDEFGLNAVVDAMVKGMLIGFVWPLGAMGWLGREEGIWPKRMQVFVMLGCMFSLSVGVIRWLGGDV